MSVGKGARVRSSKDSAQLPPCISPPLTRCFSMSKCLADCSSLNASISSEFSWKMLPRSGRVVWSERQASYIGPCASPARFILACLGRAACASLMACDSSVASEGLAFLSDDLSASPSDCEVEWVIQGTSAAEMIVRQMGQRKSYAP